MKRRRMSELSVCVQEVSRSRRLSDLSVEEDRKLPARKMKPAACKDLVPLTKAHYH